MIYEKAHGRSHAGNNILSLTLNQTRLFLFSQDFQNNLNYERELFSILGVNISL